MKMSLDGLAELAGHEGVVLMPYLDSVGVWTYGIGHTAAAGPPDPEGMPRGVERPVADALELFKQDVGRYEAAVERAVSVPLSQSEFDALVSFHYNTGAIARATLVKRLNRGDRAGAAAGFMNWLRPPEITERRRAEAELFRTGGYGNGLATAWLANQNGAVRWGTGKLVNARALLAATGDPTPVPPATDLPLSRGDKGPKVIELQQRLNVHGGTLTVDADFGPKTETEVLKFQSGLIVPGVVGPLTWEALLK